MDQPTPAPCPTLLIGSVSSAVKDAATAIRLAARHTVPIPGHRPFLATGETRDVGAGPDWSSEQLAVFAGQDAVRVLKKGNYPEDEHYSAAPVMRLRRGRHLDPQTFDLLLVPRARRAYQVFEELQDTGEIPGDARMQVDVNVIDMLLLALNTDARTELDTVLAYAEEALARIWTETAGNVVYLITMPTSTILANLTRNRPKLQNWLVEAYARLVGLLPKDAEYVLHPCNARVGNRALFHRSRRLVYKPERTVRFLNALLDKVRHRPPLAVSIPMAFGGEPPSLRLEDYEAYGELRHSAETVIFAGAAHYNRTPEQLFGLYAHLDKVFGQRVGSCFTCGFGSLDHQQMMAVLQCQDALSRRP